MKKYLSFVLGLSLLLAGATTVFAVTNPTTGAATSVTTTDAVLNGTNGDTTADASGEAIWYGPTSAGPFTPDINTNIKTPLPTG